MNRGAEASARDEEGRSLATREPELGDAVLAPVDQCSADILGRLLGRCSRRSLAALGNLGGIRELVYSSEADLRGAGFTREQARLLRAAGELGRRAVGAVPVIGRRLGQASDVAAHMKARLEGIGVEEFWAIGLNVRHRVLFDERLAAGSLTGVEVHPRDIFRVLIRTGAAAVIFCHNHPSGDPTPSGQDVELTKRLREVGELCGITVLDHVIVGHQGHVSLSERGWR
jgi:DNA repair protein RadC